MKVFKEKPVTPISLKRRSKIRGIGINDSEYLTAYSEDGVKLMCPYYTAWNNMFQRCYSPTKKEGYEGCFVCEEWYSFTTFKKWMVTQDWKGNVLDKDLKVIGNKSYSPSTCLFISPSLNSFIARYNSKGVSYNKRTGSISKPFISKISIGDRTVNLGHFKTEKEANVRYLQEKSKLIMEEACNHPKEVRECLINLANEILKGAMK